MKTRVRSGVLSALILICSNAQAGIISPNPRTDCLMAVAKTTNLNLHMNPTGTTISVVDSAKIYADPTMRIFTNRSAIGINGGTNGCTFDNKSNAFIEMGSRLGAIKDLNLADPGLQACLNVSDAAFAPIQAALSSKILSPPAAVPLAPAAVIEKRPVFEQINYTPRVGATPASPDAPPAPKADTPAVRPPYTGKIPDYGRGDSDTMK